MGQPKIEAQHVTLESENDTVFVKSGNGDSVVRVQFYKGGLIVLNVDQVYLEGADQPPPSTITSKEIKVDGLDVSTHTWWYDNPLPKGVSVEEGQVKWGNHFQKQIDDENE